MPEIDLTYKMNREIFLTWRHGKFVLEGAEHRGEGELYDSGEYLYADLINGEPVNTFAESRTNSTLPEALIKADVSERHAEQLAARGVVFKPKRLSEILGKAIERTEREIEES